MYTELDSEIRIFYGKKGQYFEYNQSEGYPVVKGNNIVYFLIPYVKDIDKIRIDPVDANRNSIIYSIELFKMNNN